MTVHNILVGIQMKRKELAKTFNMIIKKTFGFQSAYINISAL